MVGVSKETFVLLKKQQKRASLTDEKGLKYEIVEVFGTETIIWGEEDNESIQSTLSELPIGRAEQLW